MYYPPDGPAVVRVNIFVRSISKIDDVTMVSARNIKLNNNNKIKKRKAKSNPSHQKITIIIVKKREILFGLKTNILSLDFAHVYQSVPLCVFACVCDCVLPKQFQPYACHRTFKQSPLSSSPSLSLPHSHCLLLSPPVSLCLAFSLNLSASVYLVRVLQYKQNVLV